MADLIDIEPFIQRSRMSTVLDVRTPAEFEQGHIPGAHNLPLFSNDERALIGTTYHDEGRYEAMLKGLDVVGPKMRAMIEAANETVEGNEVLVHCWRGGMRSESVAWLLEFFGYAVQTLKGGYKAFRHYTLDSFELPRNVRILGGMTGAGKTAVLQALRQQGAQVIDLEGLARHKGSVFGHLGEPSQPSQEHFENELAMQWRALDPDRPVWIEDESRRVGGVTIPNGVWRQMQRAETFVLDVPFEARAEALVGLYGSHDPEQLSQAVGCIRKHLGGLRTQQAQAAIAEGDLYAACELLLAYYDKAYRYALSKRDDASVHTLPCSTTDPEAIAERLTEW